MNWGQTLGGIHPTNSSLTCRKKPSFFTLFKGVKCGMVFLPRRSHSVYHSSHFPDAFVFFHGKSLRFILMPLLYSSRQKSTDTCTAVWWILAWAFRQLTAVELAERRRSDCWRSKMGDP